MVWCRTIAVCLFALAVADMSSALMLKRSPRHIPRADDDKADEDGADSYDDSVARKKMFRERSHLAPSKITWTDRADIHSSMEPLFQKRSVLHQEQLKMDDEDRNELASILQGDDEEEEEQQEESTKKEEKKDSDKKRRSKAKRQSKKEDEEEEEPDNKDVPEGGQAEKTPSNKDFQEWLRREYYRNMAKSFASMRRKRDTFKRKRADPATSFAEITDNLRAIEDQLFEDALLTMRDGDLEGDASRQRRVSDDLSLAYDLESMRSAFFRLRDTLAGMQADEAPYRPARKRGRECPALDQLTSDCSALSDVLPDGATKRLLRRACNWHEVCYSCGKMYGLSSESCDGSFVEQTQTICRGDGPCESTAGLLVVPLRQRRVFFKRSNPDVCVEEPCVEAFLREGLAMMEEGRSYQA